MAESYDLDAMAADDALLDLLAAGGEAAFEALEKSGSDPAILLLTDLRLAVEVEDELPVEHIEDAETFLARCAALNPVTDPFARKVATRTLALGVAAVAALSVSGVAAAVTGDPLSPYEKMIEKVVNGFLPEITFPADDLEGLPVNDKARINKVAKDYKERRTEELRREKDQTDTGGQTELVIGFPAKIEGSKNRVTPPLVSEKDETNTQNEIVIKPPLVDKTNEVKEEEVDPVEPVETAKPTVAPTPTPTTTPTPTPPPTTETTTPVEPTPTPTQTETTPTPTVPPTTTGENGGPGEQPDPGSGGATTTVPSTEATQPPTGVGTDGGTKGENETGDGQGTDTGTNSGSDQGTETGADQGDQGQGQGQEEGTGLGLGLGETVGGLVDSLPIVGGQTGTGGGASAEHRSASGQSGFTPAVLRQFLAMLNGVMVTR